MRVSQYYRLLHTQASLEFIDVDIRNDTPLFIDPRALKYIDSDWGRWCVSLIQSYFQTVVNHIRSGEDDKAIALLARLSEPNETHLGYSGDKSRGHGMGKELARHLWAKLKSSRAVRSGLISDLEDTTLFIEGINVDIVSDITTNIIREPLVKFTQDMCAYYGIDLHTSVGVKRMWNHRDRKWETGSFNLPVTTEGALLLVPKSIVRKISTFDPEQYYRDYVAPFLQEHELRAGSSLVETFRNGNRRVTKKSIRQKYGFGKSTNLSTTIENEDILARYRQDKNTPEDALGHTAISKATETPLPDWDKLLEDVVSTPTGNNDATEYHRAVERLLSALLYPSLDYPQIEAEIHEGRKRIDIRYTNIAASGFFYWLHHDQGISTQTIPVECKNYKYDISNEELDQMAGRFGPNRGWVGLVLCRSVEDKVRLLERCRDAVNDDRGYIIVLEDSDLVELVNEKKRNPDSTNFNHLARKYNDLIT